MLVATYQGIPGIQSGLQTLRRLHFKPTDGLIHVALIPTAAGACGLIWKNHESESDAGGFACGPVDSLLVRVLLPGKPVDAMRREIAGQYPDFDEVLCNGHGAFHPEVVPEWFGELAGWIQSYYGRGFGGGVHPNLADHAGAWLSRLDWSGVTPFQRLVLEETARIPHGVQRTYGELAARIGKPRASRAVGAALGANPWPLLIPCHRVVGRDGRLIGFSAPGGVEAKRRMLDLESRR